MKIGVFFPSNNSEHQNVLASFSNGLLAHGIEVEPMILEDFDGSQIYDAAVVYGVGKAAVPYSKYREFVRIAYHRHGLHTMVLEKGYIKRDEYYAAGWDGLNGHADFMNCDMPPDRFAELQVTLSPYRTPKNGNILLIGQVPWDASVQCLKHGEWLARSAAKIREHTDRPIHFRPHPLSGNAISEVVGTEKSEGPLLDAIDNAYAVVTHNSNVGVDAVIAGRPVWVGDAGSMAYGVANYDLSQIESPMFPERHPWASGIAYAQWTLEEMGNGMAWSHLRHGLSMPVRSGFDIAGAPDGDEAIGSAPNMWSDCGKNNRTH